MTIIYVILYMELAPGLGQNLLSGENQWKMFFFAKYSLISCLDGLLQKRQASSGGSSGGQSTTQESETRQKRQASSSQQDTTTQQPSGTDSTTQKISKFSYKFAIIFLK